MITFLIEMLELPMLELHNYIYNIIWVTSKNFVVEVMDKNYDVINFTSKYLYFKNI